MIWTVTCHTLTGEDEESFEIEVGDFETETHTKGEAYRELWERLETNTGATSMTSEDGTRYAL